MKEIIPFIISFITGGGIISFATFLITIKFTKRKENAGTLISEIDAMKQKLEFYDTLFNDMKEKLDYYIVEYNRIRDIIIKKCPKCKNLEL
ncbi:MAG: hypothetical protein LBR79_02595 [Oscillospiraceae bacterium]|jgi:hypothetical protein|nr:hypothetical protein [Oscillospiraceae bacterium]